MRTRSPRYAARLTMSENSPRASLMRFGWDISYQSYTLGPAGDKRALPRVGHLYTAAHRGLGWADTNRTETRPMRRPFAAIPRPARTSLFVIALIVAACASPGS